MRVIDMDYNCEECYNMRQPHTTTCPNCGKETYTGQVIGLTYVWECTNCEYGVAGASFYPACWSDKTASIMITKPTDPQKMVALARILNMNTNDLHKAFKTSGDQIEVTSTLRESIRRYRGISALGVSCELGSDVKEFERAIDCPYTEG